MLNWWVKLLGGGGHRCPSKISGEFRLHRAKSWLCRLSSTAPTAALVPNSRGVASTNLPLIAGSAGSNLLQQLYPVFFVARSSRSPALPLSALYLADLVRPGDSQAIEQHFPRPASQDLRSVIGALLLSGFPHTAALSISTIHPYHRYHGRHGEKSASLWRTASSRVGRVFCLDPTHDRKASAPQGVTASGSLRRVRVSTNRPPGRPLTRA
jgi:hypothetical protein